MKGWTDAAVNKQNKPTSNTKGVGPSTAPPAQSEHRSGVKTNGYYGHTFIASVGTRYVVTCPAEPDKGYLAEWQALNERYGLRAATTHHFLDSLQDAHTGKGNNPK